MLDEGRYPLYVDLRGADWVEDNRNTSASLREDGVIDMDAKNAASVLRVSPHYFNTAGEIDTLIGALGELGIRSTELQAFDLPDGALSTVIYSVPGHSLMIGEI